VTIVIAHPFLTVVREEQRSVKIDDITYLSEQERRRHRETTAGHAADHRL
jgi:hypothetical protein